jgi:hypothetical protein
MTKNRSGNGFPTVDGNLPFLHSFEERPCLFWAGCFTSSASRMSVKMGLFATKTAWFEDRTRWFPQYRRQKVRSELNAPVSGIDQSCKVLDRRVLPTPGTFHEQVTTCTAGNDLFNTWS